MESFVPQLKQVLRGLWQGRWLGLAVAWLAGLAGAAYIFTTPDRYEATARVYVDTQSVLQPLLSGLAIQPNVEQEVAILSRTLISRPNLQKLVRMTDMDLQVKAAEERERMIDGLMRTLFIRNVGNNIYNIGFTHEQPAQAGRVVQALLSIFVESGLTGKTGDSGQAKRFIEEQIKAYEQKLAEAENRVKEFKLHNLDLNAASGDFFGNLSGVAESLRQSRLLLEEAVQKRDALKEQMTNEAARPAPEGPAEPAPVVATPDLDARISGLSKNLDDMLLRYTDNHPDVVNTRRIIKEVEAQRDEERKRLAQEIERQRKPGTPLAASNPVYPQLKLALAEAEAQVAGMRARVADYERRHALLLDRARSVPEREAQFAALNRDYAIQKQNYESLVSRRETANISGEMGAATGFADFRIIDPPRVSPNPVAPNRKMLVPLVLLASLGVGFGAAYLFSVVHPTFYDNRGLKRIGQRPVLGAVSMLASPESLKRRRRRRVLFFGGLGGLAATYGVAIAAVFLRGLLPL